MDTNKIKSIKSIHDYIPINGVVPGVKGQRAFPGSELEYANPFIMLDHIGPQTLSPEFKTGGGAHPHRGFETITFLFEGMMEHVDSLGNQITLESGSVQRMNAGSGIIHGGEMKPDAESHVFHEVQLWVNVSAKYKMSEPTVQNCRDSEIPIIQKGETKIRVVTGEAFGFQGPIQTIHPTTVLHITSKSKSEITIPSIPTSYNTFIYLLKGSLTVGDEKLEPYHTLQFNHDGDSISFCTSDESDFLLLAGQPIQEPIAMGGPFVMNTQEEIQQAFKDFNSGKFGSV